MKKILKHDILEFHPDTLQCVREACGLGAEGRVEEAVDLLLDWLAKQEHLLKKDFPRIFLENLLITCKGSVEKAKQRLDILCTMRTFAPDLFKKIDAKNDFTQLHKLCKTLLLPRMTEDYYRVSIMKHNGCYPTLYSDLYQFIVVINHYIKLHDYCVGHICILDLRDVNLTEVVSLLNPIELRNFATLLTKGYGSRVKSIYVLTPSKAIDLLISICKQFISVKIMSRLTVVKTVEELHHHVPRSILPEEVGGDERSIDVLYDAWLDVYSREEHINHMREMQEARTDESRRRAELNDAMFGLSGTFRTLNVD